MTSLDNLARKDVITCHRRYKESVGAPHTFINVGGGEGLDVIDGHQHSKKKLMAYFSTCM